MAGPRAEGREPRAESRGEKAGAVVAVECGLWIQSIWRREIGENGALLESSLSPIPP